MRRSSSDVTTNPDRAPSIGRRALALGAGALSALGITAGVVASMPELNPDAELIALCHQHIINRDAFNASELDSDVDPLWAPHVATLHAIGAAEPQTLAGMVAKAQAAKAEARLPDGSEAPNVKSLPIPTPIWSDPQGVDRLGC